MALAQVKKKEEFLKIALQIALPNAPAPPNS
jgi:hypothetical protein